MEKRFIDVTLPIDKGMPIWPDSTGINFSWTHCLNKGGTVNLTRLDMDVHAGTHVEGPLHYYANAISVDEIPLEIFLGRALVVDLPAVDKITANDLEKLSLPKGIKRLLFRTKNSELWKDFKQSFYEDFVGLSSGAAQWVVDKKIKLIGIDYLSVANFKQGRSVHEILLKGGVVILEGLNLLMAPAGEYEIICLPIKLIGREASPARVILKKL